MNCQQVQEWLELNVGCELSWEHESHLAACSKCAALKTELDQVSAVLELPSDRFPSDSDAAQLAESTIAQLSLSQKNTTVSLVSWRRLSTRFVAAAAVVLVSISTYLLTSNENGLVIDENGYAQIDYDDIEVVLPESELQPDDATIESLYSGLVNVESSLAAEVLLDDLSDDELDYLQENFDVGELLL